MEFPSLTPKARFTRFVLVLLFSALGFAVMGYHPAAEDDGIYLSAIKANLNPALYPHDAAFFQLQMRTSVFDTWMAHFVRGTGVSLAWAALLWQLISIIAALWACREIAFHLFEEAAARWAAVAMVAAMLTLPVAGTAVFLMDQYLHPRNLATALLLLAVSRIMAGKSWQAAPLAGLAFVLHPLMGAFGISFCCVLTFVESAPMQVQLRSLGARLIRQEATPALALIPFGWVFDPPSATWLEALRSRHWFRLYQWTWYEWLGAIAPLVLFWLVMQIARKRGDANLTRFALAVFCYGVFHQALAMVMLGPESLIGLSTLEPMRYLQLIYVFMALVGGGYLGKYVLKARPWRWAIFLVVFNGGMFAAQRELFANTSHLELPRMDASNSWIQAFGWIAQNTPKDAYFALDPQYLALPGEDYHSFRALAERSQLADGIKDTSVVTKVPELAPVWHDQLSAQSGWEAFGLADFERLKREFGVNWVVVSVKQTTGLDCRWHNRELAVCAVP